MSEKNFFKQVSTVYNSSDFIATVNVSGIDAATGERFLYSFTFDQTDAEFRQMFNDYGARLCVLSLFDAEIKVSETSPADNYPVMVADPLGVNTVPVWAVRKNGEWFDKVGERLDFSPSFYKLLNK